MTLAPWLKYYGVFAIVAYEFNPYRFTSGPSLGCKPVGGLYFTVAINPPRAHYPLACFVYRGVYLPVAVALALLPALRTKKRCSALSRW